MIILVTYLNGELNASSQRNYQVAEQEAYRYFQDNSPLDDFINSNTIYGEYSEWEILNKYLREIDGTYLVKEVL